MADEEPRDPMDELREELATVKGELGEVKDELKVTAFLGETTRDMGSYAMASTNALKQGAFDQWFRTHVAEGGSMNAADRETVGKVLGIKTESKYREMLKCFRKNNPRHDPMSAEFARYGRKSAPMAVSKVVRGAMASQTIQIDPLTARRITALQSNKELVKTKELLAESNEKLEEKDNLIAELKAELKVLRKNQAPSVVLIDRESDKAMAKEVANNKRKAADALGAEKEEAVKRRADGANESK